MKIIKALKVMSVTVAASFGALMAIGASVSDPYEYQNLYAEGTLVHQMVDELNVIAPGMTIYIHNVEDGRPSYVNQISTHLEFDDDVKQDFLRAYVDGKATNANVNIVTAKRKNLCAINIVKSNIDLSAKKIGLKNSIKLTTTLAHEAIHCGHSKFIDTDRKYVKFAVDLYEKTHPLDSLTKSNLIDDIYTFHAESFVGAYFLANAVNPGQSEFLDLISGLSWSQEKAQSRYRGYANAFAFIEQRCSKPGECPSDLESLHKYLVSDPGYIASLVKDIHAQDVARLSAKKA